MGPNFRERTSIGEDCDIVTNNLQKGAAHPQGGPRTGRKKMATLFEATKLNGIALQNRSVRSATWEGLAAGDGQPTEKLTRVLTDLAAGGVGMIITSHAYVSQ